MKKTIISLLLILSMLATGVSCTLSDPDVNKIPVWDPNATQETQASSTPSSPESVPSNPADLIGKWHWKDFALVLQFISNGTVKVFSLAPGYYEYLEALDGTYTYDGNTLSFELEDGTTFTGACSVADGNASIFYFQKYDLLSMAELPTEHPIYDFPDFRTLSQSATIPEGNYTELTLDGDKAFKSALQSIVSKLTSMQISLTLKTEGIANIGDIVKIDYEGKLDGIAFNGGTAKAQTVAVSDGTGMIDGFCSQIAGHAVGETFDVDVTFPTDYHSKDLAGKDAVFTMTLHGIYDMGEEWAKAYQEELQKIVFDLLPLVADYTVADEAFLYFKQQELDNYHYLAFHYGYDYQTFLPLINKTEQDLLDTAMSNARTYMLSFLIAGKYALSPDEALTKEVHDAQLAELLKQGYPAEKAEEYLQNDGKNAYEAELMRVLVSKYLVENNTFTPEL